MAVAAAPENGSDRKNRTSMSGSARLGSHPSSAASAATATAKQPRINGDDQPRVGPSMIPYVIVTSVSMTRIWPTGSSLRLTAARDSGTYRAVKMIAATPTGMFTQNTPRQPTESTRAPPMTGPVATEMPNVDPQKPIALARSFGSVNVLVTIDIATGLSIDPPTACTARNATRAPRLGARLQASEPRVNTARPIWNTLRRPTRSATEPDSI